MIAQALLPAYRRVDHARPARSEVSQVMVACGETDVVGQEKAEGIFYKKFHDYDEFLAFL